MKDLQQKVFVVTGASRGVGRGIACVVGATGATVYVTGRSTKSAPTHEDIPGTIDETAEAVTQRGGIGIPVPCDHTIDAQVEKLFAQVQAEQGHLDVLVNTVWCGYEYYDMNMFTAPFWQQPLAYWHRMFVAGVRAHYITSRLAVPLMLPRQQGLIINCYTPCV